MGVLQNQDPLCIGFRQNILKSCDNINKELDEYKSNAIKGISTNDCETYTTAINQKLDYLKGYIDQ